MPKSEINQKFLRALNSSEFALSEMGFEGPNYVEKGYAQFVYFNSTNVKVEFLFGPPEWHVDMLIYVSDKKYSLGDLLKIPVILEWVNNNRYKEENGKNILAEILWFVDLLKVSLPILTL